MTSTARTSTGRPAKPLPRPAVPLSRSNRGGLGVAVLLGLADVAGAVLIPAPDAGQDGPPAGIQVLGAALGVLTVVLSVWAWRSGSRSLVRAICGLRILSAISGLPAFFVNVDVGVKVLTGLFVLVTIACVILLLRPAAGRQPVMD